VRERGGIEAPLRDGETVRIVAAVAGGTYGALRSTIR
jgi:hypothetical protein